MARPPSDDSASVKTSSRWYGDMEAQCGSDPRRPPAVREPIVKRWIPISSYFNHSIRTRARTVDNGRGCPLTCTSPSGPFECSVVIVSNHGNCVLRVNISSIFHFVVPRHRGCEGPSALDASWNAAIHDLLLLEAESKALGSAICWGSPRDVDKSPLWYARAVVNRPLNLLTVSCTVAPSTHRVPPGRGTVGAR